MSGANNARRTEYTHHNTVDGSTRYGAALNSFPRRNLVSGGYTDNTTCGSRSFSAYNSTARTGYWAS